MNLLGQVAKWVTGLMPVADAFSGTVYSDAVRMNFFQRCNFLYIKAVGATGTATLTVEACSAADGTGAEAIPFKYYKNGDTTASDSMGAVTSAAATGIITTAGSNQLYDIQVDAKDLPADKPFVRLKSVEVVDSPVLGAIMILLHEAKRCEASLPTVIS